MKFLFNIRDISVYRSELMGWSILWIMMLHFTFNQINLLGFIAQYGFAGVDIFMLVSGLGMYFSLNQHNNIMQFYKKRLLRIFPTYYLLGILSSLLLYHDSIEGYLFRYSTIGFWVGEKYWGWYIPSIIMLYFLSPFAKFAFDKRKFVTLFLVCISILLISYYLIDKDLIIDRSHFFFLYRIPSFILGMFCAYCIKNNPSTKYYFAFLLVGIPAFVYFFPQHHIVYNFKYFSLLFLVPLFTLVFIMISKNITFINPILKKIGNASLEIYLIQSIFFHAIIINMIIIPSRWHDLITVALILLCCILGIAIHWVIDHNALFRFFRF